MCNQVKSVTLETAVLEAVREFAQQGQSFSAHDITTVIRRKCNAGELDIPTAATSGGNIKFYISHAEVNGIFKDLYRTGVFNPEFTLDRQINPTGQYFLYTPQPVSGVTYASTTTATTPTAFATTAANVGQNWSGTAPAGPVIAAPTVATSSSKPDASEIATRVNVYLNHCAGKNFRPTLKQVQSAIKRGNVSTGWTCEELLTVCENLGFTVVSDPSYISDSQVATV